MTTNRNNISKEITNPPDEGFWGMLERTSPREGKPKGYQTGAGMDFPASRSDPKYKESKKKKKKKKKVKGREVYKGGKIMVGYKAGGKV